MMERENLLRASVGLLKRIPNGYVRLGSPFHPREYPPRTLFVPEFEIAHVPVTVSQYELFLEDRGSQDKQWWSESGWSWLQGSAIGWGRENRSEPARWQFQLRRSFHPVVGITWFEAYAYCNWLSDRTKQVVRLPSEVEWERAARSDDGRPFPWGEEFDPSITNSLESSRRDTVSAGSLTGDISPFDVLEMCGNVQEWVADSYLPASDELFPDSELKVARSGSYNDTSFGARTSYRRAYPAGYFYPFLGFRVAVGYL
jgi:formylglycine-generating enzyme required for sulfatase activity